MSGLCSGQVALESCVQSWGHIRGSVAGHAPGKRSARMGMGLETILDH